MMRIDTATPTERRWLNKLEEVRPDMKPLIVPERARDQKGNFTVITKIYPKKRRGCDGATFAVNLEWVKAEVRKIKLELRLERELDIANHIGAFI